MADRSSPSAFVTDTQRCSSSEQVSRFLHLARALTDLQSNYDTTLGKRCTSQRRNKPSRSAIHAILPLIVEALHEHVKFFPCERVKVKGGPTVLEMNAADRDLVAWQHR